MSEGPCRGSSRFSWGQPVSHWNAETSCHLSVSSTCMDAVLYVSMQLACYADLRTGAGFRHTCARAVRQHQGIRLSCLVHM